MLEKAYEAQWAAVQVHCTDPKRIGRRTLTLLTLALGTFCIGSSEFASMGMIQLFSASSRAEISTATRAH